MDWEARIITQVEGGDPIYIVGIVYQQGEKEPEIPSELAEVFGGQEVVRFPLDYD